MESKEPPLNPPLQLSFYKGGCKFHHYTLTKVNNKMLQREMISDTQFIHNLSDGCHLYGPIVLESIAHSNGLSEGRSVGIVGGTCSGG